MSDKTATEPPSLDDLARRYLDLWQDQMARLANDPATTEMLAKTFTLLTRSAQAFSAATAPQDGSNPDHDAPRHQSQARSASPRPGPADAGNAGQRGGPEAAAGAEAAAAVSGGGGVDVPDLLDRLAALEKRVAELEARRKPARPGGGPGGGSGAAGPAASARRRGR